MKQKPVEKEQLDRIDILTDFLVRYGDKIKERNYRVELGTGLNNQGETTIMVYVYNNNRKRKWSERAIRVDRWEELEGCLLQVVTEILDQK